MIARPNGPALRAPSRGAYRPRKVPLAELGKRLGAAGTIGTARTLPDFGVVS